VATGMKNSKKILLLTLSFCISYLTNAQTSIPVDSVKKQITTTPIVYNKPLVKRPKPIHTELSGGIRLNTDGWSFFMDRGKVKTDDERHSDMFHDILLWQFELSEKKNPKEYKSTNSNLDPYSGSKPTPFIFGKINNFYALKLGIGKRKMIAGKPDPGTVSIHWVYAGGLSVGMLKPYYIKVYNEANPIKYSDNNRDEFLSQSTIIGAAGFKQGLHEITFIPGLHVKTALHFDFSSNRKTVLAIETGLNAEIYSQAIPIMATQNATPYFLDIYASFQFGKRW